MKSMTCDHNWEWASKNNMKSRTGIMMINNERASCEKKKLKRSTHRSSSSPPSLAEKAEKETKSGRKLLIKSKKMNQEKFSRQNSNRQTHTVSYECRPFGDPAKGYKVRSAWTKLTILTTFVAQADLEFHQRVLLSTLPTRAAAAEEKQKDTHRVNTSENCVTKCCTSRAHLWSTCLIQRRKKRHSLNFSVQRLQSLQTIHAHERHEEKIEERQRGKRTKNGQD